MKNCQRSKVKCFAPSLSLGQLFCAKRKRGFSMIELLVVVAIAVIMTGAIFVSRNNGKAASDVESAARQVASQIRALQNEALNGKQIGGVNVCIYRFVTSGSSYEISYDDCVGTAIGSPISLNLSNKKVSFNTVASLTFSSPNGGVNAVNLIELKSGSVSNWVCVSAGGVVTEQKTSCL